MVAVQARPSYIYLHLQGGKGETSKVLLAGFSPGLLYDLKMKASVIIHGTT
jgi:hypothetical protein